MSKAVVGIILVILTGIIVYTFILEPRKEVLFPSTNPTVAPTPDEYFRNSVDAAHQVEEFYIYFLNCEKQGCDYNKFPFLTKDFNTNIEDSTTGEKPLLCGDISVDKVNAKSSILKGDTEAAIDASSFIADKVESEMRITMKKVNDDWYLDDVNCL